MELLSILIFFFFQGPNKIQLPVEDKHGHSRDVYMFGVLLDYFFEKIQFSSTMQKVS